MKWGLSSLKVDEFGRGKYSSPHTMVGVPLQSSSLDVTSKGNLLSTQMPTIGHEHAVSSLGIQIAHFMPKRSQILYESVANLKV